MKNGLWVVILVVSLFMGFMMGYSVPPMIEVGMIGAEEDQTIGLKSEVDKDMEDYYKQLAADE